MAAKRFSLFRPVDNDTKRLLLFLTLFCVVYFAFPQTQTLNGDDAYMIEAAREFGASSLLLRHNDTWYPVNRLFALLGKPGLIALACISALLYAWYCFRWFGYRTGLALALAALLASAQRNALVMGHASYVHWLFLTLMLLALVRAEFRRCDIPIFFIAALNGAAPFFAVPFLVWKHRRKVLPVAAAMTLGFLIQVSVRPFLDFHPKPRPEGSNRELSFNPSVYATTIATQVLFPALTSQERAEFASYHFIRTSQHEQIGIPPYWYWRLMGVGACGWFLLFFVRGGPGFVYGVAVIGISALSFSLCMSDRKTYQLLYPDNGQYVGWVLVCLAQAAVFIGAGICRRFASPSTAAADSGPHEDPLRPPSPR